MPDQPAGQNNVNADPPGWYPHPDRPDEEWYWTGESWTESRWKEGKAPEAAQTKRESPKAGGTGWVVAGYVFLFFFPLVSLFIALGVLRPAGNTQWRWITIIFGVQLLCFVLVLAVGST